MDTQYLYSIGSNYGSRLTNIFEVIKMSKETISLEILQEIVPLYNEVKKYMMNVLIKLVELVNLENLVRIVKQCT